MDDFTPEDIAQIEAIIAADEAKKSKGGIDGDGPDVENPKEQRQESGQLGAGDLMKGPDESQQYRDAFMNDVKGAVSSVRSAVDKAVPGLTAGLADTASSLKTTVMGKPKVQALQSVEVVNGVKYVLTNGKYVKAK